MSSLFYNSNFYNHSPQALSHLFHQGCRSALKSKVLFYLYILQKNENQTRKDEVNGYRVCAQHKGTPNLIIPIFVVGCFFSLQKAKNPFVAGDTEILATTKGASEEERYGGVAFPKHQALRPSYETNPRKKRSP